MYLNDIPQRLNGMRYDIHALELFVRSLPIPVAVFNKDLFYLAASDRFFEESTIKREDTVGNPYWYDLVPDMPEKWKESHKMCLTGEHQKWYEDVFYRADGSVEWWNSEQIPWRSENGEVFGLILYIENITQRKQKETILHQTLSSLEKSNKDLSTYAHICAHDLNEPLRVISNCLQIIDNECSATVNNEEFKKYLKIINSSAKYMGDLIASLLKYCDHAEDKITQETVNLEAIVQDIAAAFKVIDEYKHAEINWWSLPLVLAEPILIKEVIQNLISNALKYNQQLTPVINIKSEDIGLFWQISVEDNGIGINKKYLHKVFDEKVRLNTSDYPGSGLGLYQCNRIINDHGGKMWVKSSEGKGSTFYFILPKKEMAIL